MTNQLIKWQVPYDQIAPQKIDEYFERGEEFISGTLADLLLDNDQTAVFHVDANRTQTLGSPEDPPAITYMKPLLLGVNYHMGHSEGNHKIVVQNVPERKGPYVLFHPPGSRERKFYLQDVAFPRSCKPKFEEDVANPLKIRRFYLFRGDPLQIFRDFKRAGYKFKDKAMSERHYDNLGDLSRKARYA